MRALLVLLAACGSTVTPPLAHTVAPPPPAVAAADDVDARDGSGWSALQNAAEAGDVAKIEALLARGAKIDASDGRVYEGATAFVVALEFSQHDAAALLLRRGANTAGDIGRDALVLAAREGFDDILDTLIGRGVPARDTIALQLAAKYDHASTIARLLAAGVPVDAPDTGDHGYTALIVACQNNKLAAARALLDAGAKAEQRDADGTTVLHWAVFGARPIEVHVYESLDKPHDTFFQPQGSAPIVELLLQRGAKVDTVDTAGNTALHEAAMLDVEVAAKVLVAAGADRTKKNRDGKTALDLARDRTNSVAAVLGP